MCSCEHGNECDETPTTWDNVVTSLAVLGILTAVVVLFIGIGYHG